jgi:transposase-like protein
MQRYVCKLCGHKFYDNQNELPRMRVNSHVIISAIDMFYGGMSTRKIAEQLENIFGEKVSQSTIHGWIHKYTKLVSQNFIPQAEQQLKLSGKYHHDETEIRVNGSEHFFWETLDEDTRYIVAHLLTKGRTTEDAKKVFQMGKDKQKPIALFTDGSLSYDNAYYAVFDTPFRSSTTEWVRRVGIRARETNNIVERLHGTLKDRLHSMRGLKGEMAANELLDGYVINYNYCRKHSSIGMTPAQAAGVKEVKGWKQLIESAQVKKTQQEIQAKELVQEVRA